jgi:hypothetical protein
MTEPSLPPVAPASTATAGQVLSPPSKRQLRRFAAARTLQAFNQISNLKATNDNKVVVTAAVPPPETKRITTTAAVAVETKDETKKKEPLIHKRISKIHRDLARVRAGRFMLEIPKDVSIFYPKERGSDRRCVIAYRFRKEGQDDNTVIVVEYAGTVFHNQFTGEKFTRRGHRNTALARLRKCPIEFRFNLKQALNAINYPLMAVMVSVADATRLIIEGRIARLRYFASVRGSRAINDSTAVASASVQPKFEVQMQTRSRTNTKTKTETMTTAKMTA